MSATLRRWVPPGWRPATVWLAAGTAGALLAAGAVAYYREAVRAPGLNVSTAQPRSAAQRIAQQHCVEGALLFHDVRWAAACMELAEQGQGDGIADCDLPDARAARLHALLQEAERRCLAEAEPPRP